MHLAGPEKCENKQTFHNTYKKAFQLTSCFEYVADPTVAPGNSLPTSQASMLRYFWQGFHSSTQQQQASLSSLPDT